MAPSRIHASCISPTYPNFMGKPPAADNAKLRRPNSAPARRSLSGDRSSDAVAGNNSSDLILDTMSEQPHIRIEQSLIQHGAPFVHVPVKRVPPEWDSSTKIIDVSRKNAERYQWDRLNTFHTPGNRPKECRLQDCRWVGEISANKAACVCQPELLKALEQDLFEEFRSCLQTLGDQMRKSFKSELSEQVKTLRNAIGQASLEPGEDGNNLAKNPDIIAAVQNSQASAIIEVVRELRSEADPSSPSRSPDKPSPESEEFLREIRTGFKAMLDSVENLKKKGIRAQLKNPEELRAGFSSINEALEAIKTDGVRAQVDGFVDVDLSGVEGAVLDGTASLTALISGFHIEEQFERLSKAVEELRSSSVQGNVEASHLPVAGTNKSPQVDAERLFTQGMHEEEKEVLVGRSNADREVVGTEDSNRDGMSVDLATLSGALSKLEGEVRANHEAIKYMIKTEIEQSKAAVTCGFLMQGETLSTLQAGLEDLRACRGAMGEGSTSISPKLARLAKPSEDLGTAKSHEEDVADISVFVKCMKSELRDVLSSITDLAPQVKGLHSSNVRVNISELASELREMQLNVDLSPVLDAIRVTQNAIADLDSSDRLDMMHRAPTSPSNDELATRSSEVDVSEMSLNKIRETSSIAVQRQMHLESKTIVEEILTHQKTMLSTLQALSLEHSRDKSEFSEPPAKQTHTDATQAQLDAMREEVAEREIVEAELRNARDTIARLEIELDSFAAEKARCQELEGELQNAIDTIACKETELEKLAAAVELQKKTDSIACRVFIESDSSTLMETDVGQLAAEKARCEELEAELQRVNKKLQMDTSTIAHMEIELGKFSAEKVRCQELEARLQKATDAIACRELMDSDSATRMETDLGELAAEMARCKELEGELQRATETIARMESIDNDTITRLEEDLSKLAGESARCSELEAELQRATDTITRMESIDNDTIMRMEEELSKLAGESARCNELEAELQKTRTALARLGNDVSFPSQVQGDLADTSEGAHRDSTNDGKRRVSFVDEDEASLSAQQGLPSRAQQKQQELLRALSLDSEEEQNTAFAAGSKIENETHEVTHVSDAFEENPDNVEFFGKLQKHDGQVNTFKDVPDDADMLIDAHEVVAEQGVEDVVEGGLSQMHADMNIDTHEVTAKQEVEDVEEEVVDGPSQMHADMSRGAMGSQEIVSHAAEDVFYTDEAIAEAKEDAEEEYVFEDFEDNVEDGFTPMQDGATIGAKRDTDLAHEVDRRGIVLATSEGLSEAGECFKAQDAVEDGFEEGLVRRQADDSKVTRSDNELADRADRSVKMFDTVHDLVEVDEDVEVQDVFERMTFHIEDVVEDDLTSMQNGASWKAKGSNEFANEVDRASGVLAAAEELVKADETAVSQDVIEDIADNEIIQVLDDTGMGARSGRADGDVDVLDTAEALIEADRDLEIQDAVDDIMKEGAGNSAGVFNEVEKKADRTNEVQDVASDIIESEKVSGYSDEDFELEANETSEDVVDDFSTKTAAMGTDRKLQASEIPRPITSQDLKDAVLEIEDMLEEQLSGRGDGEIVGKYPAANAFGIGSSGSTDTEKTSLVAQTHAGFVRDGPAVLSRPHKTLAERFADDVSLEASSAGGSPIVTPRKEQVISDSSPKPSLAERLSKEFESTKGTEKVFGETSTAYGSAWGASTGCADSLSELMGSGSSKAVWGADRQEQDAWLSSRNSLDARGRSPTVRAVSPGAPTFGLPD